ncbi:hypothetical protein AAFF_G00073540 [Aldrovandia affinis]|uniref:Uncharacterized protein n=1 Tax=Aldrovandia affinis TaxID=143900 RepID=A0AAD7RYJ8_9TELE|nr:hypothetical protein AAFF_G00073540 [Aldrovandia affinis]
MEPLSEGEPAEQQENTELNLDDLFLMEQEGEPETTTLSGRFGNTQLEDSNLVRALQQVVVVDGKAIDGKSVAETTPVEVPLGDQLSQAQRQDMLELVGSNQDVLSREPGHTTLKQHHIITAPGEKVKGEVGIGRGIIPIQETTIWTAWSPGHVPAVNGPDPPST